MNRTIATTIIFVSLSTLMSAQSYSIFSFKGEVYVKQSKYEWKPAEKGMPISLLDSLSINKQASVSLLDSKTNRIYENTKKGKMAVYELVKQAEKEADASLALVTKAVFRNIHPEQQSSMSSLGGVTRGRYDNLTYSDSLAYTLQQKIKTEEYDGKLSASKKKLASGYFHFVIRNEHDTPIYINILAIDEDTNVKLLFIPAYNGVIPIASHSLRQFREYVFADLPGIEYIVFGTITPFNSNSLETNLNMDYSMEEEIGLPPDTLFISLIK